MIFIYHLCWPETNLLNLINKMSKEQLRQIVNESYESNLVDKHLLKNNLFRIRTYYGKEIQSRRRLHESGRINQANPGYESTTKPDFRVSKGFSHSPSLRFPWVDSLLFTEIAGNNPESLPRSFKTLTEGEVRRADGASKDRYSHVSRDIPRRLYPLLARAGISAAYACGLIPKDDDQKFSTAESVVEASTSVSKSTNAGWPTLLLKNSDAALSDTINWLTNTLEKPTFRSVIGLNPMIMEKGEKFLKLIRTGNRRKYKTVLDYDLFCNPTYIFHRFQPSYDNEKDFLDIKTRQVWCIPYRIVALENYFFCNVLKSHKITNVNAVNPSHASGLTNFQISQFIISRLRKQLNIRPSHSFWSLDYSKFDGTVPSWAYDLFFSIMGKFIDMTDKEMRVFKLLRCYLKYTPYITGENLYFKRRGVPSGSLLTSLIDSWFNLLLWHCCELLRDRDPEISDEIVYNNVMLHDVHIDMYNYYYARQSPRNDLCVQGDDVCIVTDEYEVLLHRSLCYSFGMTVTNKEPVRNNDDPVFFLGRYWDSQSRPFQSEKYISSHIVTCTKFYPQEEVYFNTNFIRLYRVLSICLPLYNGFEYLEKTFKNWKPYIKWKQNKEPFYLLKEWPQEEYLKIDYESSFRWELL
jgi:hypothetical protein